MHTRAHTQTHACKQCERNLARLFFLGLILNIFATKSTVQSQLRTSPRDFFAHDRGRHLPQCVRLIFVHKHTLTTVQHRPLFSISFLLFSSLAIQPGSPPASLGPELASSDSERPCFPRAEVPTKQSDLYLQCAAFTVRKLRSSVAQDFAIKKKGQKSLAEEISEPLLGGLMGGES